MSLEVGGRAQKQNPALEPLGGLIGEWETTGSHPAVPGITLHGRASFAWQDGGAFLVWRSEIDHPDFPNGVAIFGSDDEAETWFLSYFDERGISRAYDIKLNGSGFTMERLTPKFSQRMIFHIDGYRITAKGRMSRDGGEWEDDLSLVYHRVASSAA